MTDSINKKVGYLSVSLLFMSVTAAGCFQDDPMDLQFCGPGGCDTENERIGDSNNIIIDDTDSDTGSGEASGCNPNMEPTWEDPIKNMMQTNCFRCHQEETAGYDAIQVWVESGELRTYCQMGAAHFLPTGKEDCLRWLDINVPEGSCDVAVKK